MDDGGAGAIGAEDGPADAPGLCPEGGAIGIMVAVGARAARARRSGWI
jgi:hypothetical protein